MANIYRFPSPEAEIHAGPYSGQTSLRSLYKAGRPGGGEPSKKFADHCFRFVADWGKASAEFVKQKERKWRRQLKLYEGQLKHSEWNNEDFGDTVDERAADLQRAMKQWQADMTLNPSHTVDAFADRAYGQIFEQQQYVVVFPEDPPAQLQPTDRLASKKFQVHLLNLLNQGEFKLRSYEALHRSAMFGTSYGKVFWWNRTVNRSVPQMNPYTGEMVPVLEPHTIADCPVTQMVPPDRMLVDWLSTDYNVQKATGIGHRVDIPYDLALEQFDRGILFLNRGEFERRFQGGSLAINRGVTELGRDKDAPSTTDRIGRVTLWEWHGSVPTNLGYQELCATIATAVENQEDPNEGVLVRLTTEPVLHSGLRPFVACQFTPSAKPFGYGILDSSMDLIYYISQMTNILIDNARLSTNVVLRINPDSEIGTEIKTKRDYNAFFPGKILWAEGPGDIEILNLSFDGQHFSNLIQYFHNLLEKRSHVTETMLGVSSGRISATEAYQKGTRADVPFNSRIEHFARSWVESAARISMGMIQQFQYKDQMVPVPNEQGQLIPVPISAEELGRGRFKIAATVLRMDQTRNAKAESISQVLPILMNPQNLMMLQQMGWQVNVGELMRKYCELIGIDDPERIISQVQPLQLGPGMGQPMGPPGAGPPPPSTPGGGPLGPNPSDMNAGMAELQKNVTPHAGGLYGTGRGVGR